MPSGYQVPGVYFEPRPRAPAAPAVRTDVAGFIGFEPRVRDGTSPSRLIGRPVPTGHSFRVDVATFRLDSGPVRGVVPGREDLLLSADPATIPLADGEVLVYALATAAQNGR